MVLLPLWTLPVLTALLGYLLGRLCAKTRP